MALEPFLRVLILFPAREQVKLFNLEVGPFPGSFFFCRCFTREVLPRGTGQEKLRLVAVDFTSSLVYFVIHMRKVAFFIPGFFLLSCAFSFSGFFPKELRKVEIPVFENKTLRYGLEAYVTDAFMEAVRKDGRLEVAPKGEGALIMEGTITSYSREPFEYDSEGNVKTYKVTIKAEIGFFDKKRGKYYMEKKIYSGWGTYRADGEDEEDGIKRASQDLAGEALRTLFLSSF